MFGCVSILWDKIPFQCDHYFLGNRQRERIIHYYVGREGGFRKFLQMIDLRRIPESRTIKMKSSFLKQRSNDTLTSGVNNFELKTEVTTG